MYMNETGGSGVKATPACSGVEVGGISILPVPIFWKVD